MIDRLLVLLLFFASVKSDVSDDLIKDPGNQYYGDKFPMKYLFPEETMPNIEDLELYVKSLIRTVEYFNKIPNKTDCNVAVGTFYTKALLKRTLQDYGTKLPRIEKNIIIDIIRKCENIVSHFIYKNYPYGWDDTEFRVSRSFKDDYVQVYSIGTFKKGRLNRWLLSNTVINDYAEHMDNLSLPREKYVELSVLPSGYFISAYDSDTCISRIAYEPDPINIYKFKMCRTDNFCFQQLHSSPSVSYSLSHRLLNIMMRHQLRRCYLKSVEEDTLLMDLLCAFMYRETVYLARRGFFARDLFLEHIALCSMLGYVEFHRRHWFNKAVSWMNEQGCIKETRNFDFNMTRVFIDHMGVSDTRVNKLRKELRRNLYNECHTHPMALLLAMLAQGIRYVAHYLPLQTNNDR